MAVTREIIGLAHFLKAATGQVQSKRLTVFHRNQTIDIDRLAHHTVRRERMTSDDQKRLRKAAE